MPKLTAYERKERRRLQKLFPAFKHRVTGESTVGKPYWFIHHEQLLEISYSHIQKRISYIKEDKEPLEVPIRLHCLRPVKRLDLLPSAVRYAIVAESAYQLMEAIEHNFEAVMARHKAEHPKAPVYYEPDSKTACLNFTGSGPGYPKERNKAL